MADDTASDTTLKYINGIIYIQNDIEFQNLIGIPSRLIVIEVIKDGISAVRDIQRFYERLARENTQCSFGQLEISGLSHLARGVNIYPAFRFYLNGEVIHQCFGGSESSLKSNFERAQTTVHKILNPKKKKDKGTPEDLSVFGKKFVTNKGDKDSKWVPDNMRVHALAAKPVEGVSEREADKAREGTMFRNIDLDAYRPVSPQPAPRVDSPTSPRPVSPTSPRAAPHMEAHGYASPAQHTSYGSPGATVTLHAGPSGASASMTLKPINGDAAASTNIYSSPSASSSPAVQRSQSMPRPASSISASPSSPRGLLAHISCGGNHTWALDKDGGVWRWNGANFERVPGKLTSLSVGSDGAVWGTDNAMNIYRRTQNGWQQVRGRLQSVSVGDQNNVWGVGADGSVVRYLGGGNWQPVDFAFS